MILFRLFLSFLVGLLLHQFRRYTYPLPEGWRQLTDYSIGITGTMPVFALWWWQSKSVSDGHERSIFSYILAFVGVGSGVAAGWLLDTFLHKDHEQ